MRTTMSIDERLLERAKHRARQCGQTPGQFVEASLRRELMSSSEQPEPPKVPVFDGGTPPPATINLRSGRDIAALFTDEDATRPGGGSR
ncbi:hypothetical protein FHX42_000029 [Saccharopolyspora lacisalsi]|uniref:DUF2191 domain-containing protein n=1 Tax=Halosaccharopolyspora lacisalsi TaxID=1000566 RepID=A0A839DTV2_9PSEU|nr:antitoxin [Halosaccharopolyspora lacisalsi]MBA8822675.1 hypothetical protein [Halosaccharopolyspora lacisalsi]MBA8822695.1 hypothetical protein [Halosaccharopolyspora lacisalsi]MBA8822700.1 hypothetical protein [Halosaccharopolyspora lacisalsi]